MSLPDDFNTFHVEPQRPTVFVSNRPLRDVSADALEALHAANDPPTLFTRGDTLARVQTNEGTCRIVTLGEDHLRGHLTRAADFMRWGRNEARHASPPRDVVRDILAAAEWGFPRLRGLIRTPMVRTDGSLLTQEGFDAATGLFYAPPPGFQLPPIPEHPTAVDVREAIALLSEPFADFPFGERSSRANALALALTPLMRSLITGSVPLAVVDAPQQGTGKTLLVDVASIIATGEEAAVTTVPRSDDEMRKRITAQLLGGQSFVLIDNVDGPLQSPALAAAITAHVWRDRILGHSREVIVPVDVTWAATGNNVRLIGDLLRRSYPVRLDARTSEPWRRSGFRHPDLLGYLHQNRPQLVAAALTLVRAWVHEGRPKPAIPALGSFQGWCDAVGGVLLVAGVDDFLLNLESMYAGADPDAASWTAFLETWRECFAEEAITAAAVVRTLEGGDPRFEPLRSTLPDEVADAHPERRSRALGTALAQRQERRYGPDGLRVVRSGTERHAVRWIVLGG